jgi:hypothetical protein
LLGSAAATLVAVAGLAVPVALGVVAAPAAHAAACSGSTGVTVVTDFNSLGGGVQGACVADGGGDAASSLFTSAGFPLTYAQRQPGFVCRVSGVPQSDPCVNTSPADAYWALWWSNGKDGRWTYSSLGVGSLKVPDGGYVAFSWDDVSTDAVPSYTPAVHAAPAPAPTQAPQPSGGQSSQPSDQPSNTSSGQTDGQSGGAGDSSAPSDTSATAPSDGTATTDPTDPTTAPGGESTAPRAPDKKSKPTDAPTTPGATPTVPTVPTVPADNEGGNALADPVTPTSADTEAATADDGGLPGWLAPVVIALLFAVAGVVLQLQRKRRTP